MRRGRALLVDIMIDDKHRRDHAGRHPQQRDPTSSMSTASCMADAGRYACHLDKGMPFPGRETRTALHRRADREPCDRAAHWTAEDVERRMEFGLRCAYAHGVSAIRTISIPMRARW